jgi:hypothetical protein
VAYWQRALSAVAKNYLGKNYCWKTTNSFFC